MTAEREDVPYDLEDEGGIMYNVQQSPGGSPVAIFRVYAKIRLNGELYECDRSQIPVKLRKVKDE
jgi:hypothetical protein